MTRPGDNEHTVPHQHLAQHRKTSAAIRKKVADMLRRDRIGEKSRGSGLPSVEKAIREVYGESQANYLIEELRKKHKANPISKEESALMLSVLADQRESEKEYRNVLQQYKTLKESKVDFAHASGDQRVRPGQVNLGELLNEGMFRQGVEFSGIRIGYHTQTEKFGSPAGIKLSGDRRRIVDSLKAHGAGVVHTVPEGGKYLSYLYQARLETGEANRLNAARFLNVLQKGKDLEESEKSRYRTRISNAESRFEEAEKTVGVAAQRSLNWLGRGIWSKSDVAEDSYFEKYTSKRNALLLELMNKHAPAFGGKAQLMSRMRSILENAQDTPEGMIDSYTFQQLMNLIEKEIGKEANSDQMKQMTKQINDLNEAMLDDAKKHSGDEDRMWKWRVLQLALLVSPFAGVSLLAPVLGAVGGVFSGGLATGISSIVTADIFGPFGDLAGLMKLDVAINWILADSPIVGDLIGVLDWAITSEIGSIALGEVLMPVLASPLVPVIVGFGMTAGRIPTELEHHRKYNKTFKEHDKRLRQRIDELRKEDKVSDSDFQEFASEKYNLMEKCFENEALVNLIKSTFESAKEKAKRMAVDESKTQEMADEILRKVIGNEFVDLLQDDYIYRHGYIDYENLGEYLMALREEKSTDSLKYDDLMARFYALRAIDHEAEASDKGNISASLESLAKLVDEDNSTRIKKLIDNGKELTKQDFAFQLAAMNGMTVNKAIINDSVSKRQSEAERLKKAVIDKEQKDLSGAVKDMKGSSIDVGVVDKHVGVAARPKNIFDPGPSPAPESAAKLGIHSPSIVPPVGA